MSLVKGRLPFSLVRPFGVGGSVPFFTSPDRVHPPSKRKRETRTEGAPAYAAGLRKTYTRGRPDPTGGRG